MRVGDNCLGCHFDGFGDEDAPPFTAAGTVSWEMRTKWSSKAATSSGWNMASP